MESLLDLFQGAELVVYHFNVRAPWEKG